jgi:parallel beta-helix repeat protein
LKKLKVLFIISLILTSMIGLSLNIHAVEALWTIYIRADGSIDPPTAPIQRDGNLYTFTNNIYDGIVVEKSGIVIDGNGFMLNGSSSYHSGYGFNLTNVSDVTIRNSNIAGFGSNIFLNSSIHNLIYNNNLTDSSYAAIYFWNSSGNSVSNNNVTGYFEYGIHLWLSDNNTLTGNYFLKGPFHFIEGGIHLWADSQNNAVVGNVFEHDGLMIGPYCYPTVVENNVVNGKPLEYLENVQNQVVDSAGQVILVKCSNIEVEHLDISDTPAGIELLETSQTTIKENILERNEYGIFLYSSSNNTILKNNVTDSGYTGIMLFIENRFNNILNNSITNSAYRGISIQRSFNNTIADNNISNCRNPDQFAGGIWIGSSSNNRIFHNIFIDNANQVKIYDTAANVWDDGYPSGGNYWSDYTGVDEKRGPSRNETGSDGIGDTPYIIDSNNQDNYPLMNPYLLPRQLRVEWNKTYGTTNNDMAYSLIQTQDEGFAMAGLWNWTASEPGEACAGIIKTDALGNTKWNISCPASWLAGDRSPLVETGDGGLALGLTLNSTGNPDLRLVRIDTDGKLLWTRTYGSSNQGFLLSMTRTQDDGFLLLGMFWATAGGAWLVKTDRYGNMEWNKTYSGWMGTSVIQTLDGAFAITGVVQSSNNTLNDILLKMDSYGNLLWNRTYGAHDAPMPVLYAPRSLVQTKDDGFVLIGTLNHNGKINLFVTRTDASGNMLWNRTYDNGGWSFGYSVITAKDGDGFILLGNTNATGFPGLWNVWLIRTDPFGNVIWNSTYGGDSGSFGCSVIPTKDGGYAFAGAIGPHDSDFWLVKLTAEIQDDEPPVVSNVRHEPLYPTSSEEIFFYADVTDNVAVAKVQLNYTLNGGATWLLKDMLLSEDNTYSTSLGPYTQGQILGFYVIAYDTSGNMAFGSEIVPPIPEPPKVAPIVVSDDPPNPLPDGKDVSYNVTDGGINIYVNVTEIGIYDPWASYNITYSLDGGLTWINQTMTQIGDFIWKHWVNATTNILFKIITSDGLAQSRIYWIIVGPWKYPIYLHFSEDEQYFPVKGLGFDGDYNITNNWISYQNDWLGYKQQLLSNDLDKDGVPDVWSYAYMNPKGIDDGSLVIEYWIYYAFNRYPILGEIIRDDHEHDFESIYLWIDLATGKIKKMALNQHSWVNHYTFSYTPKRINIAVEEGGHGMALLSDTDKDGFPEDYDATPGYDIWQPEGGGTVIRGKWTAQSLVASLYPWVIYDTRMPLSRLHLFGDPSILTTGFSLSLISPLLPNVVDDIPQYYGWLTDLLGSRTVLQTSFGAPIPLVEGKKLVFQVTAPWYRQEFQDAAKMWNKVPWIVYTSKVIIKTILPFIKAGIFSYLKKATTMQWLQEPIVKMLTGWVAGQVVDILFDPIRGSVLDSEGNILGYRGDQIVEEIPGGFIFLTRSMTNNMYDLYLVMTNSTDGYAYEARGESTETYNITISSSNANGHEISFNAANIPTKPNSFHKYIIHWNALENNEDGVEIWVDQNGDGSFEIKFWSDAELTASEFELATADTTPPVTFHNYDGLWHTADFTINLTATDDPSGVAETYYRINNGPIQNVSSHGQPLITIESANNTLEYWSVDKVGNEELPHKILIGVKLDKTAPAGSIKINDDVTYTSSTAVALILTAADATSGVYQVRYSNDGVWDTETWETPSTTKAWTLPSGDGTKQVYYQIKDNAGLISATYQKAIILDTTKPVANAGADQTVNEDTQITLDGSSSADNVGLAAYTWTFTDVTPKTLTGSKPTYTFNTPGVYTITLNVTDAAGNWATDTLIITVSDITKPVANAGQDKTVKVGTTVTFDAGESTDNVGIVSYEWNFGDETTGTGKTTTHTYANAGTYTVTLTVKDAAGNTATHSITVTVLPEEAFPMWMIGAAVAAIAIGIAAAATLLWKRRK